MIHRKIYLVKSIARRYSQSEFILHSSYPQFRLNYSLTKICVLVFKWIKKISFKFLTQGSHRSTTSTYVNCVCEPFLFMLFKDRLLASNQAFDNIFETINLNYEAISYKYWIFFKTSSIISLNYWWFLIYHRWLLYLVFYQSFSWNSFFNDGKMSGCTIGQKWLHLYAYRRVMYVARMIIL